MESASKPHVTVVMALYRPDLQRLEAQINSILGQDGVEVELLLFADGPMPQLPEVEALIASHSNAGLVEFEANRGPAETFMAGIEHALTSQPESALFAFADQDDVWLYDKLARCVDALQAENAAAIHTDALLLDAEGKTIAPSMFDFESRDTAPTLKRLFFRNNATGMTMLITRALAEQMVDLAERRPKGWLHDHFAAFLASARDGLVFLPEPTVRYVQHGGNVVGAQATSSGVGTSGNFRKAGSSSDLALKQGLQLVEALRDSDWPEAQGKAQLDQLVALLRGRGVIDLGLTFGELVRLTPKARPLMARLAWCKLTSHEWR